MKRTKIVVKQRRRHPEGHGGKKNKNFYTPYSNVYKAFVSIWASLPGNGDEEYCLVWDNFNLKISLDG